MPLKKRGKHWYGSGPEDIRDMILRYSVDNSYVAEQFADAICRCGGRTFSLALDDDAGAAVRKCIACQLEHPVGDSDEFLDEATLEDCACPCGAETFEIALGLSLYADSDDVRWLYLGCRCPKCGLTAVYGDWKNEYSGFHGLLAKV